MEIIIAVMFSVVFYSRIVYTMYIKSSTGGGMIMPNIKPISDLRNYTDVLHDVTIGSPVFLTKNGRGRYAIMDMQDYEKTMAALKLMNELSRGRRSGEEKGWLSAEEVKSHFRS